MYDKLFKFNKIYTGVFGNFRLVGDDGDLSAVVSTSKFILRIFKGIICFCFCLI